MFGRFKRVLLVLATGCMVALASADPVWPVPGGAPASFGNVSDIVQPTASGEVESALFGCVRTNGRRFHEGIDLAPILPRKRGEATDPVTALHDGIVRHVSKVSGNSSYGLIGPIQRPGKPMSALKAKSAAIVMPTGQYAMAVTSAPSC